ncbi:MAG: Rrf2 family transcriptional regulator, partial [Thermogutta sp.]|nr:Rrf2 family transcriptional regulator [Thermogutta sp.]
MLRISEAASLALHAMALMAQTRRRWSNEELARRLRASSHHLAKVMQRLAKAGVIRSIRGPRGGFELLRAPETISLAEIYEAVEGPLPTAECLLGEPLCRGGDCMLGELLHSVHNQVHHYLSQTTLAHMAGGLHLVSLDGGGSAGNTG